MKQQKGFKPPRPPLCLCNNIFEWALGIVSPSKYFIAGYGGLKKNSDREAAERYFAALDAYIRRTKRAFQTLQESMERASASARRLAEDMRNIGFEMEIGLNAGEKEVE